MSAAETIEDSAKRLEQVKSTLGHLMLGEDRGELYARCEDDVDDDGNLFSYGLNIGGIDSDDEINEAIILLQRTIDAQLAILRRAQGMARAGVGVTVINDALDLARAILGGAS